MSKKLSESKFSANIYPIVFLVFVIWLVVNQGINRLISPAQVENMAVGLMGGFKFGLLVAMIFALGCVGYWRIWKETGFTGLAQDARWWLVILPALFIIVFTIFGLKFGDFTMSMLVILFVNTLMVGISEETMFRGLMFSGLSNRFSFWWASIITTVIFGSMHLLNFFTTGELPILQAITTMGVGLMLLAVRVGMGSIIPAIIIHWLWDVSAALTASAAANTTAIEGTAWQVIPAGLILAPIVFTIMGLVFLWRFRTQIEPQPAT